MVFIDGTRTDFAIGHQSLRDLLSAILFDDSDQNRKCAIQGKTELTINQLASGAKRIAASLTPFNRIAICMQPSLEWIVSLCGVILRGIPYVPLEPSLPVERIQYILDDSQSELVIVDAMPTIHLRTRRVFYSELVNRVIGADQAYMRDVHGEDTFCLMYTSGSTGKPKGVHLPHRALLNRLFWQWKSFSFDRDDVCCLKTSISFVDSIAEIFAPLLQKIPIVILPKFLLLDMHQLIPALSAHGISRIVLVPSLLIVLFDYLENSDQHLPRLRFVVTSGETLPRTVAKRFFSLKQRFASNCSLINLYGSTEVMADVTCEVFDSPRDLDEKFSSDGRTSIGSPIDNLSVEILNADSSGLGELMVSGEGVASGYHNVALSNKFIREKNGRFRFRTGDLGKISNGRIILYGRSDHQIKIGGNRIDLGEIEVTLKRHCQCRRPIVVYLENQTQIIVFLEAKEKPIDIDRQSLLKHLPSYAVPAQSVIVEQFPLLVSGKIDRQQLIQSFLEPKENKEVQSECNASNESPIEHAFYAALAELGFSRLHADRHFFAAGGSSLNALILVGKLHRLGFHDLTVERLMNARALRDILLQPMNTENQNSLSTFFEDDSKYQVVPLDQIDPHQAQRLLTESFVELSEIDALVHRHDIELKSACRKEYYALLEAIWPFFASSGLSFGILTNNAQLVGISLSKDIAENPPGEPLSLPTLSPMFDMFEAGRNELLNELRALNTLPPSIMHSFLTAVSPAVEPERRVTIMYLLEQHVLRIAIDRGFHAVLTANASSVTQQLAEQVFKYDINRTLYTNQWRDSSHNLVFPHAQQHHAAVISMKVFSKHE